MYGWWFYSFNNEPFYSYTTLIIMSFYKLRNSLGNLVICCILQNAEQTEHSNKLLYFTALIDESSWIKVNLYMGQYALLYKSSL